MSFDHIERQVKLVQSLSTELEVAELDVARPYTNVELLGIEVLDIHAQEPIEQIGDETFKHGGLKSALTLAGEEVVEEAFCRVGGGSLRRAISWIHGEIIFE